MDFSFHEDVAYYSIETKGASHAQSQGEYFPPSYPVFPPSNAGQDDIIDVSSDKIDDEAGDKIDAGTDV